MKKNQLKKIVMAGLVAGTVIASQGVVNAVEGECVMAAGAACGGGSCHAKRLTADNAAPQKPGYERPATQEEIEAYKKANPNHEAELERINQQNQNQPSQQGGSCHANSGCKGKTSSQPQPKAGCASRR